MYWRYFFLNTIEGNFLFKKAYYCNYLCSLHLSLKTIKGTLEITYASLFEEYVSYKVLKVLIIETFFLRLAIWFSIVLIPFASSQEYVPGTPGAPWSREEVLTVKSKLFAIFNNGALEALAQLYGSWDGHDANWQDMPNAAKMLRLGFHDCVRYKDGSGGCDGCLNWEGVGQKFEEAPGSYMYENVGETNNNGLGYTVEILEGIYTDANFPANLAPVLNVSLKASGKSRADLWALATITAVEHAIQTNNLVCDETYNDNPNVQCNAFIGTDRCKIELEESIQFYTGRADCTQFGDQTYKATKEEVHPNAVGNGKMTADFFQENFGFTGRETVAIMGAHTIGRLNYQHSIFRYLWVTQEDASFNNGYYRYTFKKLYLSLSDATGTSSFLFW